MNQTPTTVPTHRPVPTRVRLRRFWELFSHTETAVVMAALLCLGLVGSGAWLAVNLLALCVVRYASWLGSLDLGPYARTVLVCLPLCLVVGGYPVWCAVRSVAGAWKASGE